MAANGLGVAVAEMVLPIWKERYPNDKRPNEAIQAAKQYYPNPDDESRILDIQNAYIAGAEWERNRNKWISVKDQKPDCTSILVASKGLILTMHYLDGEYYYSGNKWVDEVTHWMPLPKFPELTKQKEDNYD